MGGETVTVRMARGDRSTPWGFGVSEAANRGVIVCRVVPGSLADRAGLRNGDILDELEGLKDLDVVATDRLLVTSRDRIELIVHRNTNSASASSSFAVDGQARIWRPEITTDSQINKFQDSTHHIPPTGGGRETNVRVSLEHSNTSQPPRGFNSSALPFNTDPRVSHAQYNSPLGLYSKTNAEEQYHLQTSDALSKMRVSTPQQQPAKAVDNSYRSETMRLIQEEAARGGGARGNSLSSHPNPQGLPSCFVCQRPILGVMARAAGHEVHGDCLSCSTCGASLKNIGHHFIDDKFYCDVHGAQKKGQGPRFDSAPAPKPSTPTVAYTARAAEPPKSFYQPDVLSRRPLSVSPNPAVHSSTYTTTSNIHVSNPKTGGPISPANRGVPTNPSFGVSSARPVSPPSYAPPPPPSTAPPVIDDSSRPSSLSPLRGRSQEIYRTFSYRASPMNKAWPPPDTRRSLRGTPAYWDVAPMGAVRGPSQTLADLVKEDDATASTRGRRRDPRRRTVVQPQMVAEAREAIRRDAAHREEMATRITPLPSPVPPQPACPEPLQYQTRNSSHPPPGIPHGINAVATRSAPRFDGRRSPVASLSPPKYAPSSRAPEHPPPSVFIVNEAPPSPSPLPPPPEPARPLSFVSEASAILSAADDPHFPPPITPSSSRPHSMVVPRVDLSAEDSTRPLSLYAPSSSLLRSAYSPLPYGKHFSDMATSPNPPPAYDPATKPKTHRRVDISQGTPPRKKSPPKAKKAQEEPPQPVQQQEQVVYRPQAVQAPQQRIIQPVSQPQAPQQPVQQPPAPVPPQRLLQTAPQPVQYHPPPLSSRQPMDTSETLTRSLTAAMHNEARPARPEPTPSQPAHIPAPPRAQVPLQQPAPQQAPAHVNHILSRPAPVQYQPVHPHQQPIIQLRQGPIQVQPRPPSQALEFANPVVLQRPVAQSIEHPPVSPSIAPTTQLQKAILRKIEPSALIDQTPKINGHVDETWVDHSEIIDEADLMTEPRRSEEEEEEEGSVVSVVVAHVDNVARPLTQHNRHEGRYDASIDMAKVQRPVYLPAEALLNRFLVPDPYEAEYEDSIVSSLLLRPEVRRIRRREEDADSDGTANDDWRRQQISLMDTEGQWEKDLAMLGEINRRMKENTSRQGEEDRDPIDEEDRRRAIASIERHQRTLEQQQEQLSGLLDSAIGFLRGLETTTTRRKRDDEISIESLTSVLDELRTIGLPPPLTTTAPPPSVSALVQPVADFPLPPPRRYVPPQRQSGITTPVPPPRGSSYSRSSYEPARSAAPPTANGGGANGYRGGPRYNNTSSTTTKTVTTTYGAQPPSSLTTTRGSLQQENSTRVPYCESCNQAIRGPFVLAGGRSWCPDHFVCTNSTCRRRLLECGFVEENGQNPIATGMEESVGGLTEGGRGASEAVAGGEEASQRKIDIIEVPRPFCETCFEKHIAPKCSKCNTAIVSDCLNALQKKWHPACFTCAHCQTPFGNAAFYLEQGLPYCEKDWNMLFTTKCVSCRYPIEAGDRWVEALGSAYHSNCFSCTRCRVNLEGESFYAKNGEPYCKAHA